MSSLIRSRSTCTQSSNNCQAPGQSQSESHDDAPDSEPDGQNSSGLATTPLDQSPPGLQQDAPSTEPDTQESDGSPRPSHTQPAEEASTSSKTAAWLGKNISEHWGKTLCATITLGMVIWYNIKTRASDAWRNMDTFYNTCQRDADRHARLTPDCQRAIEAGPPKYPRAVDATAAPGETVITRSLVAWMAFHLGEVATGFRTGINDCLALYGWPLNIVPLALILLYWYCIDRQEQDMRFQWYNRWRPRPDSKLSVKIWYAARRLPRYITNRMFFDMYQDLRNVALFLSLGFAFLILVYCPLLIWVLSFVDRDIYNSRDLGIVVGGVYASPAYNAA